MYRARARAATPYGGFFDGVPTFVKDNTDVSGMPTMHGTDAWQPRPAAADGDFTKVFLSTGLIPLGKTRMPEFGFSASAEHPRHGPVRNPWDTDRTPGASSSGASVFVASGAVPIAHANDGGGSIRIPASCTGLVGLKPSRGRLPLERQMQSDADPARRQRGPDAHCPRHRRVLPRDGTRMVQPETAGGRRRDGRRDRAIAGCGVHPFGVAGMRTRDARPDVEDGSVARRTWTPRRARCRSRS